MTTVTGAQAALFLAVVGARFVVPLFIPRFPLPAIVAALVLDAVDQTIFQFFGYDPPGYQGYDKAMDVYYLAIAYLSTMRNWTSAPAVRVAKFLYFYRLVGVVLFEATDWRAILLIFPNTFEYFFIAYEIFRLRRDPARRGAMRPWIITAAVIWIFIKLPQEWWIHVAQLDFTEAVADFPWLAFVTGVVAVALAWVAWRWARPRLPAPDWPWRVRADALPEEMDTASERNQWILGRRWVFSTGTLEKVVLVGLLSLIYGQVLPGRSSTNLQLVLAMTVFVVINAAVSLWMARRSRAVESVAAAFALRALLNSVLVVLADWLLNREGGDLNLGNALFFVLLLSLLTLLDDRYRPVYEARFPPLVLTAGPEAGSGTR
jgi:hypothetical protein